MWKNSTLNTCQEGEYSEHRRASANTSTTSYFKPQQRHVKSNFFIMAHFHLSPCKSTEPGTLRAMIFFNLICCKLLASTLKWPACSLLWSMGLRSGLWVQNLGMLQCAIMWKDQKISSTYTCLLWWQTAALFSPHPHRLTVTALLTGMEHKTDSQPYCQEWNIKWTHRSIDRNGIKTLTAPLTGMEYIK